MRVVFAWLIADSDMHLKNMAVLKIAEPGNPAFRSVRLAREPPLPRSRCPGLPATGLPAKLP